MRKNAVTHFPKEKIRNLLIDFGVVLIDLDRERCLQSFQDLGVHGMEKLLNNTHQQGFLNDFERGNITSGQFCAHVRAQMERPDKTVSDDQILAAWNSFLVGIPTYKLDLLLLLRKHYRLLLLSNTNEAHWQWSCRHDFSYGGRQVTDFFHDIYLSFKLHVEKSRPEIFRQILDDSGINPGETLFIDDSPENCRVGQQVGFYTYAPGPREDWNQALQLTHEKPFSLPENQK